MCNWESLSLSVYLCLDLYLYLSLYLHVQPSSQATEPLGCVRAVGREGRYCPSRAAATDLWEEEGSKTNKLSKGPSRPPPDLDKSSHLVDTLSSEVSSNVVTLETTRRRRQKKAASALCGLSCRRTREGGRAGRLGPSGRDGAHPRPPHRLQQTPILGPRHPTILVRGGTLKIHTSTIQHNQN